ncbi:hypothetical protein VP01_2664g2 [Puccinia sorghi]|uniref:Uncharacterized protein n=1 Tax=Puccinia sorghi TaxID=27349 RepID=A0A0L6V3Y8_9BASI|nr:hypothetical protein VP01_2664g2 [Puccinia sorghi]
MFGLKLVACCFHETVKYCVSACTTHARLNIISGVTFPITYHMFLFFAYHHMMATKSTSGYKDEIKTGHHLVVLMSHGDFRAKNRIFPLDLLRYVHILFPTNSPQSSGRNFVIDILVSKRAIESIVFGNQIFKVNKCLAVVLYDELLVAKLNEMIKEAQFKISLPHPITTITISLRQQVQAVCRCKAKRCHPPISDWKKVAWVWIDDKGVLNKVGVDKEVRCGSKCFKQGLNPGPRDGGTCSVWFPLRDPRGNLTPTPGWHHMPTAPLTHWMTTVLRDSVHIQLIISPHQLNSSSTHHLFKLIMHVHQLYAYLVLHISHPHPNHIAKPPVQSTKILNLIDLSLLRNCYGGEEWEWGNSKSHLNVSL